MLGYGYSWQAKQMQSILCVHIVQIGSRGIFVANISQIPPNTVIIECDNEHLRAISYFLPKNGQYHNMHELF